MKFEFIDANNIRYQFEFDVVLGIAKPHIEITVEKYYDGLIAASATTRPIINKKVKWWEPEDHRLVSSQARHYIDKVIKNLAFC